MARRNWGSPWIRHGLTPRGARNWSHLAFSPEIHSYDWSRTSAMLACLPTAAVADIRRAAGAVVSDPDTWRTANYRWAAAKLRDMTPGEALAWKPPPELTYAAIRAVLERCSCETREAVASLGDTAAPDDWTTRTFVTIAVRSR
jgi:hypothetical protein